MGHAFRSPILVLSLGLPFVACGTPPGGDPAEGSSSSSTDDAHSTGPGAVASPTRPQLGDADAARYTAERVLDGWNPRAPTAAR